jgi:hypothetical protein
VSPLLPVFLQSNSLPFQSGSDESGSLFPYLGLSGSRRQEEKPEKKNEERLGSDISESRHHQGILQNPGVGINIILGIKKNFPFRNRINPMGGLTAC